jgi:hypothetical protein
MKDPTENKEVLDALVEELRGRHGCHTVILYGSRARGEHRPGSDYDVVGLRDYGPSERDARPWRDGHLDAWIFAVFDPATVTTLPRRLEGARVLLDRGSHGADMVVNAQKMLARPRPPPAEAEVSLHRNWFEKMLQRVRRAPPDDAEAGYRQVWLLTELLPRYFQLRGQWYLGPRRAFETLAEHDPEARRAFDAALRPGAGLPELEALVACVLPAPAPPA